MLMGSDDWEGTFKRRCDYQRRKRKLEIEKKFFLWRWIFKLLFNEHSSKYC